MSDIETDLQIQEDIIAEAIERDYNISQANEDIVLVIDPDDEDLEVDPSQLDWDEYVERKQCERRQKRDKVMEKGRFLDASKENLKRKGIRLMIHRLTGFMESQNIPDLKACTDVAYKYAVEGTKKACEEIRELELDYAYEEHEYERTAGRFDDI